MELSKGTREWRSWFMMDPKCWHEGKSIIQDDEGLLIHETKASGESGAMDDEPTEPLFGDKDPGAYGSNPWRGK
jgi:hypothetical protein